MLLEPTWTPGTASRITEEKNSNYSTMEDFGSIAFGVRPTVTALPKEHFALEPGQPVSDWTQSLQLLSPAYLSAPYM